MSERPTYLERRLLKLEEDCAEKERLLLTLRSMADALVATDELGRIVYMNAAAENLSGWSLQETAGQPIDEIFRTAPRDVTGRYKDPILKPPPSTTPLGVRDEVLLTVRDGTSRIVTRSRAFTQDESGRRIGESFLFHDITPQRKFEEILLTRCKLECCSHLAGSIGHNLNNIMTGILGNISLAKLYAKQDAKVFDRLEQAEKASVGARNLTEELLALSDIGSPVRKPICISRLIKQSASSAIRDSRIACSFSIADDLWQTEVDKAQITKVIDHLVTNAKEAMPEGGVIKIGAGNVPIGADSSTYDVPLREGKYVKIYVKDQGVGIAPQHLQRVFDPYFTTKRRGGGLGLSVAYAIMKKHDGYIDAESTPGVGTTFNLYLPAFENGKASRELDDAGLGASSATAPAPGFP